MSTSTVPSAASTPLLCAVYTRVSAEGRADEDFSSTDAQFMACQELITSQRGNGERISYTKTEAPPEAISGDQPYRRCFEMCKPALSTSWWCIGLIA